jgi:ribulose bisphosphate carboxylase small subunit
MQTLPKERRYETLSYLPPLSDAQISKQIQYILDKGYIPAIELMKFLIQRNFTGQCGNYLCLVLLVFKKC